MKRAAPAMLAAWAVTAPLAASSQNFDVPPELWDRPRSGSAVRAQPALRQAIDLYLARPGARLVVRHGPGQESLLAAEELRAWLVALAIEPGRIALRGDLRGSGPLRLEVMGNGE